MLMIIDDNETVHIAVYIVMILSTAFFHVSLSSLPRVFIRFLFHIALKNLKISPITEASI